MGKLWLETLELHNIKQHTSSKWVFANAGRQMNLIGMIGPNGSGKSTILDSLLFLFTGDIPGENKADLIGWGNLGGKSYVQAKFLFDGKPLELYREAHASGAWLKADGKMVKGITSVNRELEERLGIDKDLCQKSMFVRQNDIIEILFTEPAKRKKAWQKLMGMGEAENVHIAMGNYLSGLPPVSDHVEELENNKLRLAGIRSEMHRLRQIHTAKADYGREVYLKGEITRLEKQITEVEMLHRDWTQKKTNASRLETEVQKANRLYTAALEEQDSVGKMLVAAGDAVDDAQVEAAQKAHDEMAKSIKAFETVSQVADMLEADYRHLDNANRTLANVSLGEIEKLQRAATEEANTYARDNNWLQLNKDLAAAIAHGGVVNKCPLCLGPVVDGEVLRIKLNQRIADLMATMRSTSERLARVQLKLNGMQTARTGGEKQVALMEQQIKDLIVRKDQLVADITTSVELSGLLKLQSTLQNLKTRRSMHNDYGRRAIKAEADLKSADMARNRAFDEWNRANIGLAAVSAQLTAMPGTEVLQERIMPLRQELVEQDRLVQAAATIAGQWKGLKQSASAALADIERLQGKMDQEKARREAVKVLEDTRNFFHHSQGPTLVVSRILEDITGGVNEFLGYFNAPYTVIPDFEQMSFRCIFTDGRASPETPPLVNVLSGGQKVALALSFRLAGYFMFSSRIGFITIDEPTNHLDEQNIDNFRNLMERLKVLSQETGLQILISTHARSILNVLDYIIDLAPEKQ